MAAIAAVFTESSSSNARDLVEEMLTAMKHRGDTKRIATAELKLQPPIRTALGCAAHHDVDARFIESPEATIALDGSFFEVQTNQQANRVHDLFLHTNTAEALATQISRMAGAFSLLLHDKGMHRLLAYRDPNGLKPLYYTSIGPLTAFASERKALWKIGFRNVERATPGYIYDISPSRGLIQTPIFKLSRQIQNKMSMPQASTQLLTLLTKSIRNATKGSDRIAVSFSGGLDSALTAYLANQTHPNLQLVNVGLPEASELATAEKYARMLNLPITVEPFPPDSLEQYVRRIIWLIEEPSLMKVSIAVPLHWSAMITARLGMNVLLCGQGSDELYGGYHKYSKTLDEKGRKALEEELYQSVVQSHHVNFERDDQATSPFNVELRTPFTDLDLIQFSMQIPSEFKVKPGNDLIRKWVLRSAAQKAGLPYEIVWRKKKAIQHGTGVENEIRKLAKRSGSPVTPYLTKIFTEVKDMTTMP